MVYVHPSEVSALREHADRLELENQRLREIISNLKDNEAYLQRRVQLAEARAAYLS